MSGHFFAFKNREKTSETRKNSLRGNICTKKLDLISHNSSNDEFKVNNNQISEKELIKIN